MRYGKKAPFKSSPLLLGAFFAAVALIFAACSGDNSTSTTSDERGCATDQTKLNENYTSSALMLQILGFLKGETQIEPLGLFTEDSHAVQEKIEKYGIEVSSQTKSSMNFRLEGKDYSFKVPETKDTVKVSLSSAGTTCELIFKNPFANQCLQESTDATIDLESNQAEFVDCIKGIAPASKEGSDSQKPGYDGEFN